MSEHRRRLERLEVMYRAVDADKQERLATLIDAMTPADRATYERMKAKYEPVYHAVPALFTLEVLEPDDDAVLSCVFLRAYHRLGVPVRDEYRDQMEACIS